MAHYVICSKCGKRFDRDKIQAVRTGARRYAHYECEPTGEIVPLPEKDPDLVQLEEYIDKLFGKSCNKALVNRQIKEYTTEKGYSYSGILKSLIWFYEVKGNSTEQSHGGIGIVPYIYEESSRYWIQREQEKAGTLEAIVAQIKKLEATPKTEFKATKKKKETHFYFDDILKGEEDDG